MILRFLKVRQTKGTTADSCDSGISVLNLCLSWSKFVNINSSHSRQWFNIHIVYNLHYSRTKLSTSISVWKEKRSTCCQLLPSSATSFQYRDTRAQRHKLVTSRYEKILPNEHRTLLQLLTMHTLRSTQWKCEKT